MAALDTAGDDAFDGDEGSGAKLAALEDEPIAAFTPPGAHLALAGEDDEDTALGKPVRAMVVRVYSFDTRESARAGGDAAVAEAKASGWQVGSEAQSVGDGRAVFGTKTLSTGEATLSISDYQRAGQPRVSIRLEDGPCPVGLCD